VTNDNDYKEFATMFVKPLTSALAVAVLGLLTVTQIASADPGDGGCCGKKCTSVPDVKKVAVRCYSDTCEDICLPSCCLSQFCSGLFRGWHCPDYCGGGHCGGGHCDSGACDTGCDSCSEGKCKKNHCPKKELVVKIRTHEEPTRKCVADVCPAGGCAAPVYQMAPPPPGKGPEVIPAPKGAPGADQVHRPLPMGPMMNVVQ
jgi:hypothetical protein